MERMGYDALNLGGPEFIFGKEFLEQTRSRVSFPYIASNLLYGGSRLPWTREYVIKDVGGIKVAILGILDPDGLAQLPDREQVKGLEVIPPEAALERLLLEVRGKADLVVLLSLFDAEKTFALAKGIKGVDVAISSVSDDAFFLSPSQTGNTILLQVRPLGRLLGLLKITFDDQRAPRVSDRRIVSLGNSVPDHGEIARLVEKHKKIHETIQEKTKQQKQDKAQKELMEGLKLSPREFMERYRKELL